MNKYRFGKDRHWDLLYGAWVSQVENGRHGLGLGQLYNSLGGFVDREPGNILL